MAAVAQTPRRHNTLAVAGGAHALHDGYSDLLYVMLPLWQAEFGLVYAQVGLLRGLYAGSMAAFQVPASLLAERLGAGPVLAAGTAVAALSMILAGITGSYASLLIVLMVAGFGASVQHPIASGLVSRAYEGAASRAALGTYNFAGDVGKMTVPAATAWMLTLMPWRPVIAIVGGVGLVGAGLILGAVPRRAGAAAAQPSAGSAPPAAAAAAGAAAAGSHDSITSTSNPARDLDAAGNFGGGFVLLSSIGILDSATRMGFLTFLPFVLGAKGASLSTIGLALTLVFAGGAVGKFACGLLGARLGVTRTVLITEGATAAGIIALLPLPLAGALLLMPLIGVALNGTSSVL